MSKSWEDCLGVVTICRGSVPVGAADMDAVLSRERGQANRKRALLAALVAVLDANTALVAAVLLTQRLLQCSCSACCSVG
jgi:GH24 family phage-related lysozyme (muramidase)